MAYIYDLTDTWNAGGTTFNGIKLNVTDSASAVSSKLVTLQTNGTEHFSVTKAGAGYFSGNVGIGVTAPASKFEVAGAVRIKSANADTNGLNLSSDAGGIGYINAGYATVGQLVLQTQSTERMRIDASGNVGIGIGTSGDRLNVGGNIQATQASYGYLGITSGAVQGQFAANAGGSLDIRAVSNHPMTFFTNNTERARIDSSGNVGIGTSSPSGNLHINGTAAGLAVETRITNTNATGFTTVTFGDSTTTFGQIWSGNASYGSFGGAASMNYSANSGPHVWYTNYTERMRIDSSGNLLVGRTAGGSGTGFEWNTAFGGYTLTSSTGIAGVYDRIGSDGQIIQFRRSGTEVGNISVTTTATSYNTSSDYRLKDIDGPIANSGAYIDALNPVQGSWKIDGSRFIGLLAHEVQKVSETPIATGEKDGEEMQAMDYSAPELIANLIAEIQSMRLRLAQLEGN